MDKEFLNKVGTSFDLDETTKAYGLVGKRTHWTEYSVGDDWDADRYFQDFDYWWKGLDTDIQESVYREIRKKSTNN